MTEHSQKNLDDKLGVRPGESVLVIGAPEGYLALVPKLRANLEMGENLTGKMDFIQIFARDERELQQELPRLTDRLLLDGKLWVSWAKRSSALHSGLDENAVRSAGLAAGMVDVKVVAISEDWSGLKFVFGLADRKG